MKNFQAFRQQGIQNCYNKAKLLNPFTLALKDARCDEAFVEGFAVVAFVKLRETQQQLAC